MGYLWRSLSVFDTMHSVLFTEENSPVGKKTAKGVSENVTKRKLWHQGYKFCLFEKHK